MNAPPWMPFAWADLHVSETPGRSDNPRIVDYFRRVGHANVQDDETPWCAAFVGACLERAGLRSTRSLAARSYLDWGVEASAPSFGAIVVLSRGRDPALGHVGFLVGSTHDHVYLLGGNQSNAVTVEAFDRRRVLGWRLSSPTEIATASASAPTDDAPRFAAALAMVLVFEGGWSDDPFDPGGPTNKGITLATFARERGVEITAANRARLVADLRGIPDRLVALIYRERYWLPAHCPELPATLALFHFDVAVNMGVGSAIRMLQEALGVAIDGEIGPLTRRAANTLPIATTLERYADLRRVRYRSLATFWRFGRGWLTRSDAGLAQAIALIRNPHPTGPPTPPISSTPPQGNRPMSDAPIFSDHAFGKPAGSATPTKWWGGSLTIWGTVLTAVTTVAPALFAALGIDLPIDLVQRLGSDVVTLLQAIGGLVGTILTIVGRLRASTAIVRRPVTLRL